MLACFGNLGPGNTLGLTSAESYATAVRGTCCKCRSFRACLSEKDGGISLTPISRQCSDGLSAAIGKVGAVVGTETFNPIKIHLGQRWTFIIAALCGLLGIFVAYFFIRNE